MTQPPALIKIGRMPVVTDGIYLHGISTSAMKNVLGVKDSSYSSRFFFFFLLFLLVFRRPCDDDEVDVTLFTLY